VSVVGFIAILLVVVQVQSHIYVGDEKPDHFEEVPRLSAADKWDYHPITRIPIPHKKDAVTFYSYHIHTYFLQNNANVTNYAISLRNAFIAEFKPIPCDGGCDTWCPEICVWDLNMVPRGPHPLGSWGVYLPTKYFEIAVPWIMARHNNSQSIWHLIHPNSGYPIIDHSEYPLWIGDVLPLDLSTLTTYEPPPKEEL